MNQTIQQLGYKTCAKCGKVKPVAEFYASTHSPDGLHSYCKECMSVYGSAAERKKRKEAREQKKKNITEQVSQVPQISDSVKSASINELVEELRGRGKTVLVDPTPRELIEQLVNKGYAGTLEYFEKKTISLSNFKSA
jgi:hypothetical protein